MDDNVKTGLIVGVPLAIGSTVLVASIARAQPPVVNGNGQPPPQSETDYMVIEPASPGWTRATFYNQNLGAQESHPIASQHIRNSLTQSYNYENINETQWLSAMNQLTAMGL